MISESTAFSTWIPDENRFNLEAPPTWVLSRLADFDAQLVVIPSRFNRRYLLARRRQHSAGLGDVAMLDNKHPDTNMMYAYGLIPIAPLKFGEDVIVWTQRGLTQLIETLKARDAWELTGGPDGKDPDATWKAVEAHEAAQERKQRRDLKEMFYHKGRDAYRSLKARIGERFNPGGSLRWAANRDKPTSGGTAQ